SANGGLGGGWSCSAWAIDTSGPYLLISYGTYGSDNDSIMGSTDSGVSWKKMSVSPIGLVFTFVTHHDTLFAATATGLFFSTNHGADWTIIDNDLPLSQGEDIVQLISLNNKLFTCIKAGLFESTDNGKHWSPGGVTLHSGEFWLAVSGSELIYMGMLGGFESKDGGATWTQVQVQDDIVGFYAVGAYLFKETFDLGNFYSTNNGDSWTSDTSLFYPLSFGAQGSNLYAGTFNGIFRSTNKGASWSLSTHGLINSSVHPFARIGQTIFCAARGAGIFMSSNQGDAWVSISQGLWSFNIAGIATIGSNLFALSPDSGLYMSMDLGQKWKRVVWNFAPPYSSIFSLNAVDTILYIGSNQGLYRSTNLGKNWTLVGAGTLGGSVVLSIANQDGMLYAGTGNGMWTSSDAGASWQKTLISPPGIDALVPLGSAILAVTSGIVLLYTNDSTNWRSMDDSLLDMTWAMGLSKNDEYVFVGTDGQGVWRRPLSDFGISSVAQTPPVAPMEIQSYPNPFSQRATISFTTESPGYADVRIMNLLGAEVARLYSGELSAGEHSFTWDAARMSAPRGMYECVVRMNGQMRRISIALAR
ncbi:MAG: hypothetical protein ACHQNE_06645, partial [Candidatus Kapaibacterium sp.]